MRRAFVRRVGLRLYSYYKTATKTKRLKESFEGDEHIYYLDCGDDTSVCICPNSPNWIR